jgi:hypothetical protein
VKNRNFALQINLFLQITKIYGEKTQYLNSRVSLNKITLDANHVLIRVFNF